MIIYVCNKEVETKEIVSIKETGSKSFGFVIHLTGGRSVEISEPKPFDMLNFQISFLNSKYDILMKKVEAEWQKDKVDHIVLDL